jgi:hypothetical protein
MRLRLLTISPRSLLRALLIGPALLAGCAMSPMAHVCTDPTHNAGAMKYIFVDSVEKEPVGRPIRGDAFVEEVTAYAISVCLPNATEEIYVPGYTRSEAMPVYGPALHQYATHWRVVQAPGHNESREVRRFRTDVWTRVNGGRLVWAGAAETGDVPPAGRRQHVTRSRIVAKLVAAVLSPSKEE